MDHFAYRDGALYVEEVSVATIAECYGTPCYIYSRATLQDQWRAFDQAFAGRSHLICYAVKANSNLAVLNVLAHLGSGFDIVSIGELERVLAAHGEPQKIVFSGVGKREDELRRALEVGIRCFNIEVIEELYRLNRIAGELGSRAPVALRVNPDVDARTHPYISTGLRENKFGIDIRQAVAEYRRAAAMPHLQVIGIGCHIGSQLTTTRPFLDALDRVLLLANELDRQGICLHHLDIGGGLGIRYRDEQPPEPSAYANALLDRLGDARYDLLLEPGRAITGNAGILLTRVEYLKSNDGKHFAIVDAAMNDLIRPALYDAWHAIVPVQQECDADTKNYDIVGPVCETGDFLGRQRELSLKNRDLLAVRSAGAYGFSMSSNYNSRPRPPEIMVDGDKTHLVRERETVPQLWRGEHLVNE